MTTQDRIIAALEAMRKTEPFNTSNIAKEALWNCTVALERSVESLENYLSNWLWVSEDEAPYEGSALAHVVALGLIEEELVMKSMIYND